MYSLIKLECVNYRSLYNFALPLNSLTILVGRNDAGKSNVLRAIDLLLNDSATERSRAHDWPKFARPQKKYPRTIVIKGTLQNGSNQLCVQRSILLQSDHDIPTSTLEVCTGSSCRPATRVEKDLLPDFYFLQPRTGAIQESFRPNEEHHLFSLMKDWVPEALQKEAALHKLMRDYVERVFSGQDLKNLNAYFKFLEGHVEGDLQLAFPEDFSERKLVPEFRGKQVRNQLLIREKEATDTKARIRLPIEYHGTGLISVLAVVWSIAVLEEYQLQYRNSKPFVVAIEEPEVHLHAQAQRQMSKYIKLLSSKHQAIVTTHSTVFVDRSQPQNVVLLRRCTPSDEREGKGTAGQTLAVKRLHTDNWAAVSSELGIKLSDVFMTADAVILVEGQTEATILPAAIGVLSDDGKSSLDYGRAIVLFGRGANLPTRIEFFRNVNCPVFAVLDLDTSGLEMQTKLNAMTPRINGVYIPTTSDLASMPPPMNLSQTLEAEDLFDCEPLIEVFNEVFSATTRPLPTITIDEYRAKQRELQADAARQPNRQLKFGFVRTANEVIREKSGDSQLTFNKVELATGIAEAIGQRRLKVPQFYERAICAVAEYLANH